MWNKLAALQLFLNLYRNGIVLLLRYKERPFIESKDYLFQLISVAVSICRKEPRNKKKLFPLDRKSFSTGAKSSPNKLFPLISVKVSMCRKKSLNKRKRFSQDRKSIYSIRNKTLVQKQVSDRQKIPFTSRNNWKMEKTNF